MADNRRRVDGANLTVTFGDPKDSRDQWRGAGSLERCRGGVSPASPALADRLSAGTGEHDCLALPEALLRTRGCGGTPVRHPHAGLTRPISDVIDKSRICSLF